MKQFIVVLVLVAMQYTVNPGDTLQSIAEQYCQGDVWVGLDIIINRWE
ncbi:LysM peptidoglycan-binding domain-containing protein [Pelosinus fermentans]|nr:LysM peptidoglycan-binding domain-containing protein [Pelosinus fermentans]